MLQLTSTRDWTLNRETDDLLRAWREAQQVGGTVWTEGGIGEPLVVIAETGDGGSGCRPSRPPQPPAARRRPFRIRTAA